MNKLLLIIGIALIAFATFMIFRDFLPISFGSQTDGYYKVVSSEGSAFSWQAFKYPALIIGLGFIVVYLFFSGTR